jgi:hypothetical protein
MYYTIINCFILAHENDKKYLRSSTIINQEGGINDTWMCLLALPSIGAQKISES